MKVSTFWIALIIWASPILVPGIVICVDLWTSSVTNANLRTTVVGFWSWIGFMTLYVFLSGLLASSVIYCNKFVKRLIPERKS